MSLRHPPLSQPLSLRHLLKRVKNRSLLARHCGVSRYMICHLLHGRRVPTLALARRIATFTGTRIDPDHLVETGRFQFIKSEAK